QAKELVRCLADSESLLLLAPPGVGKSEVVRQAAAEAGLEVRSLLGTQIAPEDVSGVPKLVGGRAVFCPPRLLLPDDGRPFCLFLDELPAAPPDVQKAFYSLLLERRIGEHRLPPGTWVVAAGNRSEARARGAAVRPAGAPRRRPVLRAVRGGAGATAGGRRLHRRPVAVAAVGDDDVVPGVAHPPRGGDRRGGRPARRRRVPRPRQPVPGR